MLEVFAVLCDQARTELLKVFSKLWGDFLLDQVFHGSLLGCFCVDFNLKLRTNEHLVWK